MVRKFTNYEIDLINSLKDKEEAEAFLNAALQEYLIDSDSKALNKALYYYTLAKGNITKTAENKGLNRENLQKMFAGNTKPRLDTIYKLLGEDFELIVRSKPPLINLYPH